MTPKILDDLKQFVRDQNDIRIKFTINFHVRVAHQTISKEPISSFTEDVSITDYNRNQFIAMLGSGCEQKSPYMNSAIDTELFLFIRPQFIQLEKAAAKFISTTNEDYQIKFSLALKCSPGSLDSRRKAQLRVDSGRAEDAQVLHLDEAEDRPRPSERRGLGPADGSLG